MSQDAKAGAQAQPIGDPIKTSVLKSSAVMALGTLVSRVLGFVRWSLLIAAIGGLAANDAFQIANNLPNMVYNLLAAGVLDAILVPQIVRAFKTSSGSDYVNRLITLAGMILFGITLLTLVGASVLVNIFAVEMAPGWKSLAVVFSLWCLPQIFFYGLYNLLGETLNARGIFGPYTWVPVVNNLIGIAGLIVFIIVYGGATNVDDPTIWTFERTALLAGPATIGVIAQALALFIPLRRAGIRIRPDFQFKGAGLRSATKIAGWVFAVLIVNQLSIISTTNIAAAANNWRELTGQYAPSITAVNFTFMIYMMPQSIIATSIAIAVFTRIASATADNDLGQVSKDFHLGVRLTTVLNLWAAAILGAGAIPIFQALAPRTGPEQVYGTALALVVMLPGLAVAGISTFSHRVFYALEEGKPIFLSVLAPTVAFVIASWILKGFLPGYLWVTGALATEALMRIGVAYLSLNFVSARIPGVRKQQIIRETLAYSVISVCAGTLAYGLLLLVDPYAPGVSYSAQLFGAAWRGILVVLVVSIVYVLLMGVFDRPGLDAILDAVGNRIPIVKQFGEKLPQVNLLGSQSTAEKTMEAETLPEALFYPTGNDPQQPVWFSEQLARHSGFDASLMRLNTTDVAETTVTPAPIAERLLDAAYKLVVNFLPAPVKHADPTPAPAVPESKSAAAAEAELPEVTSPAFPAAAEVDPEETMVIGHLPPVAVAPKQIGSTQAPERSRPLVIRRPRATEEETSETIVSIAKSTGSQLTSFVTPALSKLKRTASSALQGDKSDKGPASSIGFKNGIMVETLHKGTRVISQSLESARQTVDDFQTGKRVDPTKPTIVIFVIATIVALLMALATLGLLPSGGSHIEKSAGTDSPVVVGSFPAPTTDAAVGSAVVSPVDSVVGSAVDSAAFPKVICTPKPVFN